MSREVIRTCDECIHKEVCKFLHGATYIRFKNGTKNDFIKELEDLKGILATRCKEYYEIKLVAANPQFPTP